MDMAELEITVERCREGDEDAWSALVSATLRPIYRLCASYAPPAAEADELCDEVYFKLWENLHRYKPGSNFMAWAWRVASRLVEQNLLAPTMFSAMARVVIRSPPYT